MGASLTKAQTEIINNVIQQSFSSVLSTTTNKISNFVSYVNKIYLTLGKGAIMECSDGIELFNENKLNLKYTNQITSTNITDVKKKLNDEIKNENSQTMKIVRELLGNYGSFNNDEMIAMIQSRVSQLIESHVTVQHDNQIMNSTISLNETGMKLEDGAVFKAKFCKFHNNALIDVISDNIANDLIQVFIDDEIINRIINDSKQDIQKEEKGLNSIFNIVFIIGAIVVVAGMIFKEGLKGTLSAVRDYRLWIVLGIISLIAYIFKFFPFKRKQKTFFGCGKDINNFPTGTCVEYNNSRDGPFWTKELCEKALDEGKVCQNYWGCNKDEKGYNDRKCRQYITPLLGPYKTKETCEELVDAGKACPQIWSCQTDKSGFNVSPPSCSQYKETDPNIPDIIYPSLLDCQTAIEKGACMKHYSCNNKTKKCQETYSSPYTTTQQCESNCK